MFEVQKSAPPLPPKSGYRARKYPLDTMDVGDWFFVPNRMRENLDSHVHTTGKKLGRKFSLGMVYMVSVDGKWTHASRCEEGSVYGVCVVRIE